jgi:hypothetical protein
MDNVTSEPLQFLAREALFIIGNSNLSERNICDTEIHQVVEVCKWKKAFVENFRLIERNIFGQF